MSRKIRMMLLAIPLFAATASAIDFGAHIGYYDNDVKKAFIGADLMLPIGNLLAIAPNIDYTKIGGSGPWWGNGDLALRFNQGRGPSFWVGAGPTYYYVTNASESSESGYARNVVFAAASGDPTIREWGWDINGGIAFAGSLRPYITARYNKIKEYKAGGVAIGLRFGR